jgi:signal transduction histidine kinase
MSSSPAALTSRQQVLLSPVLWWRRRSLRARLTTASTAVIAVGITLAAALLVWRVHTTQITGLDSLLSQRARDVSAEIAQGQLSAVRSTGADSTTLVQVVNSTGQVITSSANIDGEPALFTLPVGGTSVAMRQVSGIVGGDAATYRVAAVAASSPTGPVTVYAGRPTSDITQSTQQLAAALSIGAPLLVLLLATVAWALVGRALRPVEAMRDEVSTIPGTDLHRRLPVSEARDELQRLARTFNELLDRIEASAAQQRRFLADAAHELRNPVASLHTRLDVRTSHPELPLSPHDRRSLARDAQRLAGLVDSLLSLARLDAHTLLRHEPVDLDDLIFEHVRRLKAGIAPDIDTTNVSGAQVLGDRAALDRVVANLLDNAARHAATTITVSLNTTDKVATMIIADDGPGIPGADRDRVFERFTRLDDARTRDRGGAGLGLAIVHDIVHAHGGAVHITDNRPGARFVVTIPAQNSHD